MSVSTDTAERRLLPFGKSFMLKCSQTAVRRKPCIARQNPLSADFKSEVIITYVSIADKTVSAKKQRLQFVEKVCFFKKVLVLNP